MYLSNATEQNQIFLIGYLRIGQNVVASLLQLSDALLCSLSFICLFVTMLLFRPLSLLRLDHLLLFRYQLSLCLFEPVLYPAGDFFSLQ